MDAAFAALFQSMLAPMPTSIDYDALRREADPANWPPPRPFVSETRWRALSAMEGLLDSETTLDSVEQRRTCWVKVGGPAKAWSSAKLKSLTRINLVGEGLMTDQTAKGKVLVLRIISMVVRRGFLHLVVEDRKGDVARAQLHNVHLKWSHSELNAIYRLGSYWALKEPTIRTNQYGSHILIDSPPDLVRLWPSHPWLASKFKTAPPTEVRTMSPLAHKNKGNALIASAPLDALEHYSLAIDQLAHPNSSSSADRALLTTLFSNRAAVHLKLDQPGRALRDCELGLADVGAAPGLKVKLLYRSALACYAMERFEDAQRHVVDVIMLAPTDATALSLHARLNARLFEEIDGLYDWPALYARSKTNPTLDIASYCNWDFEVRQTDSRGRGLFATSPIEPGELLFVQRPLAIGRVDKQLKTTMVRTNLWTSWVDVPTREHIVAGLIERCVDRGELGAVGGLWAGKELGRLEPDQAHADGVDVTRLEGIATYNCFSPETLTESFPEAGPDLKANTPSALYLLPSFMNHSCLANVTCTFIGDVVLARARVHIPEGTELTRAYSDPINDLEARREDMARYDFVCGCELCKMDDADGAGSAERRAKLAEGFGRLDREMPTPANFDPIRHVSEARAIVAAMDATYTPSRSPLRPSMHSARQTLAEVLGLAGEMRTAVEQGVKALEALGAEFAGEDLDSLKLVAGPKVGDTEGVLLALRVALYWGAAAQKDTAIGLEPAQHWVTVARQIERNYAGDKLFVARYGEWAKMNGLEFIV